MTTNGGSQLIALPACFCIAATCLEPGSHLSALAAGATGRRHVEEGFAVQKPFNSGCHGLPLQYTYKSMAASMLESLTLLARSSGTLSTVQIADMAVSGAPYMYSKKQAARATPNKRKRWLIPVLLAGQILLKVRLRNSKCTIDNGVQL